MTIFEDIKDYKLRLTPKELSLLKKVDSTCKKLRPFEDKYYLLGQVNEKTAPLFRTADLFGLPIAKKYGGKGVNLATHFLMMQRLGQEGSSVRTMFSVHSMCQVAIQQWGTERQKKKYLPKTTKGKLLGAFALTEPLAGSDPSSLKSTFNTIWHAIFY